MKKIKVAIISAGMIANAGHIPAYKNLDSEVEVIGVCDLNKKLAQETAKRFSIPNVFIDAKEMLNDLKPDLVSICTPTSSHVPLVKLSLEAGANVICEKPIALRYKDALEIYSLAKEKGKLLVACQTVRYRDDFLAARNIVSDGTLGDIYFAELSRIRRRGFPKWGSFHKKAINGGGAFCDIGVHMLDSILWIMGNPKFKSITGRMSSHIVKSGEKVIESIIESGAFTGETFKDKPNYIPPEEYDVEEFAAGTIKLENECIINFKVAFALNLQNSTEFNIAGTKAGISIPKMEIYSNMGKYQITSVPSLFNEGKYKDVIFNGHWYLIEHVVNVIKGEEELMIKPEESINVVSIIDAFYLSAEKDKEVWIDDLEK